MSERRGLLRVYGDSLSLPRASEGVLFEQTFPALLDDAGWSVCVRSNGGATVSQLRAAFASDAPYFGTPERSVVVIQSGVVDCAPRPIPHWLRQLIARLPGVLLRPIVRFLHDHRARLIRMFGPFRRTSPASFASEMRAWLREASAAAERVIVINVLPTLPAFEEHSPGFQTSIREYNRLIADAVAAAGPNVIVLDVFAPAASDAASLASWISAADGHHLTRAGHQMVIDSMRRAGVFE